MEQTSMFCKFYGDTISNRILEYMLENQDIDFAVSDMAKELNISKPKAYEVIKKFQGKEFVEKSRLIGKTQLYILNKKNHMVQIYLRNFNECLNMVIEEYGKGSIDLTSIEQNTKPTFFQVKKELPELSFSDQISMKNEIYSWKTTPTLYNVFYRKTEPLVPKKMLREKIIAEIKPSKRSKKK